MSKVTKAGANGVARKGIAADDLRKLFDLIGDGASVRAACRDVGVPRDRLLRLVEKNDALRSRFQFAIAARAHAIADSVIAVATGEENRKAHDAELKSALDATDPKQHAAVVRALSSARVQRDRLIFDALRWTSSRLLPAVYGAAARDTPNTTVNVVVKYDAAEKDDAKASAAQMPSGSDVIEDADFSIVE